MEKLLEWLAYSAPWWLFSVPAAVGVAGVFIAVSRVAGLRNAAIAAGALAAAVVSGLSRQRGRQEGWNKRVDREKRDANEAVRRAKAARDNAQSAPAERLRDDDGFRRD